MQETSLHAALKDWYTQNGDQQEVPVDGFQIDVVHRDLLIEIQTGNFTALKSKLPILLENHPVCLVHPIAQEKWIVRLPADSDRVLDRRKSPKRGRAEHLFLELVRIPHLVNHPNFHLEVLLVQEEEIRRNDGRGSWRRKGWSIMDRRLLGVISTLRLETPDDFRAFLPQTLPQPFTTRQLASAGGQPTYLAGKMAYCLSAMGLIRRVGKQGRAYLYQTQEQRETGS
jgi:hypothetical protein